MSLSTHVVAIWIPHMQRWHENECFSAAEALRVQNTLRAFEPGASIEVYKFIDAHNRQIVGRVELVEEAGAVG